MPYDNDPNEFNDTESLAEWLLRNRRSNVKENIRCFKLNAFCWSSGKNLFLKKATKVCIRIDGPGDPVFETFYFSPKHFTLWLLKE